MKLGLSSTNLGQMAEPERMARIARLAEELGYDSLWVADHVVMADPSPRMSPAQPFLDPLLSLTWLAAHTTTIQLATGIVILPQRQPTVLAKQLATLDLLSGGRLLFGIGVGWQEAEMHACGARMDERGARTREYLAAMRALWTTEKAEYHGKFVDFAGVTAYPRPVQKPGPRLIMGGYAPATFRRTVRLAHGWYGYNQTVEQVRETIAALNDAASQVQRPPELGPIEITVSPREQPPSAGLIAAFADAGVDRVVISVAGGSIGEVEDFVREHAPGRLLYAGGTGS
jgi:probable F420-dependent oxidoreductase